MIFGNLKQLDKRDFFFIFALFIFSFVVYKTIIAPYSHNHGVIKLTVIQNNVGIANIDQPRNIQNQNSFYVNILDFTQSNSSLSHSQLGNIGYSQNFFIDFETKLVLSEDKNISFTISSDDGFNLLVNNTNVLSYKTHRPLMSNTISVVLNKGVHNLKLNYYQGGSQLGIKAEYKIDNQTYFIGKDSKFVQFMQ